MCHIVTYVHLNIERVGRGAEMFTIGWRNVQVGRR